MSAAPKPPAEALARWRKATHEAGFSPIVAERRAAEFIALCSGIEAAERERIRGVIARRYSEGLSLRQISEVIG